MVFFFSRVKALFKGSRFQFLGMNFQRAALKISMFHSQPLEIQLIFGEYLPFSWLRKRHKAFSNSEAIAGFNRGTLTKKDREKCIIKTTKKVFKNGRWSFSGNRFLKGTQSYPLPFGLRVVALVPQLCAESHLPTFDDASTDAVNLFSLSAWNDLWLEAKVLDACIYLRGGIHLRASPRWKSVFPTEIPMP